MNRPLRLVCLCLLWVFLWGELSLPNVISGLAVSAVLMAVFPIGRPRSRHVPIRPLAMLRLGASIAGQLVVSNAVVSREIVTRGSRIRTAIVACRLHGTSPSTLTMVSNIIALSPGMMVVDAQPDQAMIHVHVLHFRSVTETRRLVAELESLVVRAFGTPEEIAVVCTRAAVKVPQR